MRPDDSDRKAVLGLLKRLTLAWNSGAADAYADLFTDDADYVTRFGVNVPGPSTQTLVAVREPDGWRIASFQNTPQTPVHGS